MTITIGMQKWPKRFHPSLDVLTRMAVISVWKTTGSVSRMDSENVSRLLASNPFGYVGKQLIRDVVAED